MIKDRAINLKPTKSVEIHSNFCPRCGSQNIKRSNKLTRKRLDMKFSKNSIKKSIVNLSSWRYKCLECFTYFVPKDWPINRTIYGHGFIIWCIYQNVVCKQKMFQVRDSLRDLFEVYVNKDGLYNFRSLVSEYYESIYKDLLSEILKSPAIHIDETTVNLRNCKACNL